MITLTDRVKARVRDTICRACIYRTAEGGCSRGGEDDCPILSNMESIIELVSVIQSSKIDPYVARLREVICRNCANEDPQGRCKLRNHADCALDDYFPLLVDLVEQELNAGSAAEPGDPVNRKR